MVGKPLEPNNAKEIDGYSVFTDAAARDIPYFFPKQRRPVVSNPANRVILPEGYPRNARSAFIDLDNSAKTNKILASHFISADAFEKLKADQFESFIELREQAILQAEGTFLNQFGLHLDIAADRNAEEVDNDE
jgi:hypothetical protein